MKNSILIIGILWLGVGCSNPEKQEEKMAHKYMSKINSVCNLTPDETNKITPIIENFVKLTTENRDKYKNNVDAFRKANLSNREKLVDTLKTILTTEQFTELQAALQQQKAKYDEQKNGGEQDGPGGNN